WTIAQGKIDDDFPLPAIVKPAAEDASAGLDRGSVVADRKALRARVAAMTEHFVELLGHRGDAGAQRLPVGDDRAAVEPGARVFGGRLDDGGQREVVVDLPLRDGPARNRET